jgi:hypothetical protein
MARRDKTFKPDKDLKTIRHQGLYYFCQKAAKVSHSKERPQQKLHNLHQEKIEGILLLELDLWHTKCENKTNPTIIPS